jgi:SAM-dependent methyltransferase
MKNLESYVIEDFGLEWKKFNQEKINKTELKSMFKDYFFIFPFNIIGKNSEGFDMGSGSGRWAQFVLPRVKKLNCIEPSKEAIKVSKKNLKNFKNCIFINNGIFDNTIKNNSQDFGYCLGVLHHLSNTFLALKKCVEKLKKNSPFLIYVYYKFDNRPAWFMLIWKLSDILRKFISLLPFFFKSFIAEIIAMIVYFPLARICAILFKMNIDIKNFPLSYYMDKPYYAMRTDCLDRFGTKLEQRFTKKEIKKMMINAGLKNIKFSNRKPYWTAIGYKR